MMDCAKSRQTKNNMWAPRSGACAHMRMYTDWQLGGRGQKKSDRDSQI
jgi:hypothetical protein